MTDNALPDSPEIRAMIQLLADPPTARAQLEQLNQIRARERNLEQKMGEIARLTAAAAADREAAASIRADTEQRRDQRAAAMAARGAVLDRVERELAQLLAEIEAFETELEGAMSELKPKTSRLPRRPRSTAA
jgi:hypothetical protein